MHLHFKPGTQFLYSGEGINLVQFVIEQQKKKPLDELMQAAIFTPLGMMRTGVIYRKVRSECGGPLRCRRTLPWADAPVSRTWRRIYDDKRGRSCALRLCVICR
jgi:CubicO group peptidase (beta-lactamase class C family)